jgi:WD40 repeat protein
MLVVLVLNCRLAAALLCPAVVKAAPDAAVPEFKHVLDIPLTTKQASGAAFSPSGKILAVSGLEPAFTLWDTESWKAIASLPNRTFLGQAMAFTPDGSRIVAAEHGRVLSLDTATLAAENLAAMDDPSYTAMALAVSPDGRYVAATTNWYSFEPFGGPKEIHKGSVLV